jgi:hypothetical protein
MAGSMRLTDSINTTRNRDRGHDKDSPETTGKGGSVGTAIEIADRKSGRRLQVASRLPRFYNRNINTAKLALGERRPSGAGKERSVAL